MENHARSNKGRASAVALVDKCGQMLDAWWVEAHGANPSLRHHFPTSLMENAEVATSRKSISASVALQNCPDDAVHFAKSMPIVLLHGKQSGNSTKVSSK